MAIGLTPYLMFPGTARSALEFYRTVFEGQVEMMTFAEGMGDDSADKDLLMHGSLFVDRGIHLMASDTPSGAQQELGTISLSNSSPDEAEHTTLLQWWQRLSQGAEIAEPLAKSPWGDTFGILKDRFGVSWMINASA